MCIIMNGTWRLETVCNMSGSCAPPDTSFTISAPACMASSATFAWRVSIEIGISDTTHGFIMDVVVYFMK